MTHRERMMAAIRGEATDTIPWAPRLDLWFIAQRERGTLPSKYNNMNMAELAREFGWGCHAIRADFTTPRAPGDMVLRGLGLENHPDYPYRIELRDLPVESRMEEGEDHTRFETSKGEITSHIIQSEEMRKNGISLPFKKSHPIEDPEDLERVAELFDHLEVIPSPEGYARYDRRVGEAGVAVSSGPLAASPIHLMLHELMAMDKFFYYYADNRSGLYSLAEHMEPLFDRLLEVLADSPAEVIFWGANYDRDLTWPPFFRDEIRPWLQKASAKLHQSGKFLLTHTDGENRDLLPLYPDCGFDVAESVCPSPMTSCSLEEIRTGMGPDTTVWGGVPSVLLLEDSLSDAEFDSYLSELRAVLSNPGRIILGVSDNVPPDANMDRLKRLGDLAASLSG